MEDISVEKVTLNIGAGEAGDKLEKAVKLLEKISGAKPVKTKTMKRIPTWGLRPNLTIGVKVTSRGKKAEVLLKNLLQAKDNKLKFRGFDKEGNFSFGIEEYLLIPGVEYDISIGVIGLEAAVTLYRRGYRVKRRRIMKRSLPLRHKIKKDEAIEFVKSRFGVDVEEKWQQNHMIRLLSSWIQNQLLKISLLNTTLLKKEVAELL